MRSKISIEIENFDRDQIFLIVGPSGFENPETIRENQTIRANLRIDSRDSGHLRSIIIRVFWPFVLTLMDFLREAKLGGFQTRVFPIFFGEGPDCVADPFGTVPRRCS